MVVEETSKDIEVLDITTIGHLAQMKNSLQTGHHRKEEAQVEGRLLPITIATIVTCNSSSISTAEALEKRVRIVMRLVVVLVVLVKIIIIVAECENLQKKSRSQPQTMRQSA